MFKHTCSKRSSKRRIYSSRRVATTSKFEADVERLTYYKEGLAKAYNTNQSAMGVLWLRDRLRDSMGKRTKVDFHRMDSEFATLKKVVGIPKHAIQRGAGLQPLALGPVFQGVARGPPGGFFPPPGFDPSSYAYAPEAAGVE